jgi:hypothetical protein
MTDDLTDPAYVPMPAAVSPAPDGPSPLRVTPPVRCNAPEDPSAILQTENRTVTFAGQKDGPLRVTCSSWPDAVVHPVGEAIALQVTEIDPPPLPAAGVAFPALSAGR